MGFVSKVVNNDGSVSFEQQSIGLYLVGSGIHKATKADLDAAATINDLSDIGAIQFNPDHKECWSVTITVNNVEPCGAVLCDFWQGDCYNVELRVCNP